MRVRVAPLLLLALVMLFAGCTYGSLAPVRFTYVVKYSVSSDAATPTGAAVSYTDEDGNTQGAAANPPWSFELPVMSYDYGNPYYAQLVATAAGLAAGESVTVAISWKDYRTGFTEEVLVQQTVTNADVGTTPLDVTLYAPELPLAR